MIGIVAAVWVVGVLGAGLRVVVSAFSFVLGRLRCDEADDDDDGYDREDHSDDAEHARVLARARQEPLAEKENLALLAQDGFRVAGKLGAVVRLDVQLPHDAVVVVVSEHRVSDLVTRVGVVARRPFRSGDFADGRLFDLRPNAGTVGESDANPLADGERLGIGELLGHADGLVKGDLAIIVVAFEPDVALVERDQFPLFPVVVAIVLAIPRSQTQVSSYRVSAL